MMTHLELIRVLIVDDHPVVRRGIHAMVVQHDDMQVVGEADRGEQALTLCALENPDVVLMDLVLPGIDGIETTRRLLTARPSTKVLALTSSLEEQSLREVLAAGATGYLLKSATSTVLADAIRAAHEGRASLAPEAAQVLVRAQQQPAGPIPLDPLTEREMDALRLLVAGLSNAQIADEMMLGRSTVKYHVSNLFSKLGVTTRAEAAAIAVRLKLVE
jgi:NarL family two-component system response regulator LiaR